MGEQSRFLLALAFIMTDSERQPCASCGHPALVATIRATGGFCRRCKPGQPSLRPPVPAEGTAFPVGSLVSVASQLRERGASHEELVLLFVPALVAMLAHHEKQKGGQLTREEVETIRDKCVVMAVAPAHSLAMAQSRGYQDIDPNVCWEAWQQVRLQWVAEE